MPKKILTVIVLLMLTVVPAFSDAIWNERSASAYSNQKPFKVGDIIMVLIVESTSAVQKSGTDTQAQDSLSISFSHTITKLNNIIGPDNSVQGSGSNAYKGEGSTSRSSNVLAAVAATVTNILQNGNLVISGNHKLSVNDESQDITIKGVVRPSDVSGWNTVYSYQVADSSVAVKGMGAVGEASSPGWIVRFLNFLF